MKSLTVVRKKTLYPVEFKIKRVELSHCSEMSVALLAREDRQCLLLFKGPKRLLIYVLLV